MKPFLYLKEKLNDSIYTLQNIMSNIGLVITAFITLLALGVVSLIAVLPIEIYTHIKKHNLKTILIRSVHFFIPSSIRFFFLAAVIAFGILWYIDLNLDPEGFHPHDIIVEMHGVLFDLVVFGILIAFYERVREKRGQIEKLQEEIEDFQGWDEKEATFRVVGAIRRLNKLGVSQINLEGSYLKSARLQRINLKRANLENSILQNADLQNADLQDSIIKNANLRNANLRNSNLSGADFSGTNLHGANLQDANLKGANLQGVSLLGVNLKGVNLQDSNLEGVDLEGVDLQGVNLEGANLTGASVDRNWFEKLEFLKKELVKEIKTKYFIGDDKKLLAK